MATTAGGLPYVEPSDLVSGWPAVSQSLAETLDTQLAAKAPLASPALTGTPTAPTAAAGTNTTQIATTAFVQASGGLVLITSQSFSAASAVNVNNCFTSTYDNYLVELNVTSTSATAVFIYLRMRASGSDAATAYYWSQVYTSWNTTVAGTGASNAAQWAVNYVTTAGPVGSVINIQSPNLAQRTMLHGTGSSDAAPTISSGYHNTASQYDGFSVYPASGTFTGTIRVYGYRNS